MPVTWDDNEALQLNGFIAKGERLLSHLIEEAFVFLRRKYPEWPTLLSERVASSSAVLLELREKPLSPYAASKLAGELYCRTFGEVYGQTLVVTRFFNVFGPRQVPDSPYSGVVAAFCFALLRGQSPRIDGDGGQSRDFTYVGDVARGLRTALDADLPAGCHTVNLAGGGNISILDLLNGLKAVSGVDVEPAFGPSRTGDVRHSQADVTRLAELLGFRCEVSFEEGLRRTYDWYRSTYA